MRNRYLVLTATFLFVLGTVVAVGGSPQTNAEKKGGLKEGAKEVGSGTKKVAKTVGRETKKGAKTAADKTEDAVEGTVKGARRGASDKPAANTRVDRTNKVENKSASVTEKTVRTGKNVGREIGDKAEDVGEATVKGTKKAARWTKNKITGKDDDKKERKPADSANPQ